MGCKGGTPAHLGGEWGVKGVHLKHGRGVGCKGVHLLTYEESGV